MSPKITEIRASKHKAFYARLPARTYRKLRKLAQLEKLDDTAAVVPVLFLFRRREHDSLRKLALTRSLNGQRATMKSVLVEIIDAARISDLKSRAGMHEVVRQLIRAVTKSP